MRNSFWTRVAAVVVALCTTAVLFESVSLLGHPAPAQASAVADGTDLA